MSIFPSLGGRFAAQQAALQRELHQDALARSLDSRPSIDTLVDAGIIQSGVAPGLQVRNRISLRYNTIHIYTNKHSNTGMF